MSVKVKRIIKKILYLNGYSLLIFSPFATAAFSSSPSVVMDALLIWLLLILPFCSGLIYIGNRIDIAKDDLVESLSDTNNKVNINNADFAKSDGVMISDETLVEDLKHQFMRKYNISVRIYKEKNFAKGDSAISSIKSIDSKIDNIYFSINSSMLVKDVEERFNDSFGVIIHLEDQLGDRARKSAKIQDIVRDNSQHTNHHQAEFIDNFKVDGRMKVLTFKNNFEDKFGVKIRVYSGRKFADDNATLASVRVDGSKAGKIAINESDTIDNIENLFLDKMGIKVRLEDKNGELARGGITLAEAAR